MITRRDFFRQVPARAADTLRQMGGGEMVSASGLFDMPQERLARAIPRFTGRKWIVRGGNRLYTTVADTGEEILLIPLDAVDHALLACFGDGRDLQRIAEAVAESCSLPCNVILDKASRLFLEMARHWVCIPANPL